MKIYKLNSKAGRNILLRGMLLRENTVKKVRKLMVRNLALKSHTSSWGHHGNITVNNKETNNFGKLNKSRNGTQVQLTGILTADCY